VEEHQDNQDPILRRRKAIDISDDQVYHLEKGRQTTMSFKPRANNNDGDDRADHQVLRGKGSRNKRRKLCYFTVNESMRDYRDIEHWRGFISERGDPSTSCNWNFH